MLVPRVWLPHQAAYEYHNNRVSVIAEQYRPYGDIRKQFADLSKFIEGQRLHPFIGYSAISMMVKKVTERVNLELVRAEHQHTDLLTYDAPQDRLADIFEGRVGVSYTDRCIDY